MRSSRSGVVAARYRNLYNSIVSQNVRELGMSVVGLVQLAAGLLCLGFVAAVYVAHGISIVLERARETVLQAM